MKTSNLFFSGLAALALGACAGSNVAVPQKKSLIQECYSSPSICARSGYENFVSSGEGYSKQDAVDMAKLNVKKQIAQYLFGSEMTISTNSVKTSSGKSSEIPRTNSYETSSIQVRTMKETLPKIIWDWECRENANGNKCYVVGYIPK